MSRLKKYVGLAALVAIVAALGISSAAMAQSTATPVPGAPTAPTNQAAPMGRRGGGFGLRSQAALEAAAKALGMTADELQAQLWGGKALADIATEKKVDIATVQKAVEAAELAETRTAIAAAVTAGTLTQAKADWLLEGLDKGYWGNGKDAAFGGFGGFGMGPGGFGMGPGAPGGHGGFGGPAQRGAPPSGTAPNSNGTTTPSGSAF